MKLFRWLFLLFFAFQNVLGFTQESKLNLEFPKNGQLVADTSFTVFWNTPSDSVRFMLFSDSALSSILLDTTLQNKRIGLYLTNCQVYFIKLLDKSDSILSNFSVFNPTCLAKLRIDVSHRTFNPALNRISNSIDTTYNFHPDKGNLTIDTNSRLNNNEVVNISGNNFLESFSGNLIPQPFQFIIFTEINNDNSIQNFFDTRSSVGQRVFSLKRSNYWLNSGSILQNAIVANHPEEILFSGLYNGFSSKIFLKDSLVISGNAGTNPFQDIVLGGFPGFNLKNYIAEFLLFTDSLSMTELDLTTRYFKSRYAPDIFLGLDTLLCTNQFDLSVDSSRYSNILWSTGDTTALITITQNGTYWVSAKNIFGETTADTIRIGGIRPPIQLDLGTDTVRCFDTNFKLNTGLSNAEYDFNWSNASSDSAIFVLESGSYKVNVTDTFGCAAVDSIHIAIDSFALKVGLPNDTSFCAGNELRLQRGRGLPTDYVWSTGDSTSSITVSTAGLYTLTVTNENGCQKADTIAISIKGQAPQVQFLAQDFCFLDTVKFTDASIASVGNVISWDWQFGDGQSSALQNPTHIYAVPGKYEVALTASTDSGCAATFFDTVEVYHLPVPSLEASGLCSRYASFLQATATTMSGAIQGFEWNVNQTGVQSRANLNQTFSDSGLASISLVAISNLGCRGQLDTNLYIKPSPTASAAYDIACQNQAFELYAQPTAFAVDSQSLSTGNVQTNADTLHFQVNLQQQLNALYFVLDTNGCFDSVRINIPLNLSPTAFTSPQDTTVCLGESAMFNASLPPLATVIWNTLDTTGVIQPTAPAPYWFEITDSNGCRAFSDTALLSIDSFALTVSLGPDTALCAGNRIGLINPLPSSFNYLWNTGSQQSSILVNQAGAYDIEVGNTRGCIGRDTVQVGIKGLAPLADFSFQNACLGDTVIFVDASVPLSGQIVNWSWQFGNGQLANGSNTAQLYATAGKYPVTLSVTTDSGCVGLAIDTVQVYPLPEPLFDYSLLCSGQTAELVDTTLSWAPGFLPNLWLIETQTGTVDTLSGSQVNYVFPDSGFVDVSLVKSDFLGCSASLKKSLFINPTPSAAFSSQALCAGDTITFSDATAYTPLAQQWSFSNGIFASGNQAKVLFQIPAIYAVNLAVQDASGCADTLQTTIEIQPKPIIQNINSDTICLGDTLVWNSGLPPFYSFVWQNGATSPSLSIADSGRYNVQVTDTFGCISFSDTVSIAVNRFANLFSIGGDTTFCEGGVLRVRRGQQHIDSISWNGIPGGLTFFPAQNGIVTATAFDAQGCIATKSINFNFQGRMPQWQVLTNDGCVGSAISFQDLSTPFGNEQIVARQWHFANGNSTTNPNTTQVFNQVGNANYDLSLTLNNGCVFLYEDSVFVNDRPLAIFGRSGSCTNAAVQFFDASVSNGNIISWLWDFGDPNGTTPNISNLRNPQKQYASPGNYAVNLEVLDNFGCRNDTTVNVVILQSPTADFTADTACFGQRTQFFNQSSGLALSYNWSFAAGQISNLTNPQFSFGSSGLFNVMLTALSANGCSTTVTNPVLVVSGPVAQFEASALCVNDTIRFVNSTSSSSGIERVSWNIAGQQYDLDTVIQTFNRAGFFPLSLAVTDSLGCKDSLFQVIEINENPIIEPFFEPDFGIVPFELTLNANLQFANNQQWYLNGDIIGNTNPTLVNIDSNGIYLFELLASNEANCSTLTSLNFEAKTPKLDLAFVDLSVLEINGRAVLELLLENAGNRNISSFKLLISHPAFGQIIEEHVLALSEGDQNTIRIESLPLGVQLDASLAVCVELIEVEGTLVDDVPTNNHLCATKEAKTQILQLYPSPAEEYLDLKLQVDESAEIRLVVTSAMGKTVLEQTQFFESGFFTFRLNILPLQAGVYQVTLIQDGKVIQTLSFVKG